MLTHLTQRLRTSLTPKPSSDALIDTHEDAAGSSRTPLEASMLANIKRMCRERAEDIMIPRVDIIAVDLAAPFKDIIKTFQEASLTRMPVYQDTLDNPLGFLHFKDLALAYGFASEDARAKFVLKDHVRRMLYIPPSMPAEVLLSRMQSMRVHMALVIDEFGGVDGLVTIEDLVERIVGDIEDEHDNQEPAQWVKEASTANTYLCDARTSIADFEQEVGCVLRPRDWEDEVDTLGGLVFTMCGRVPERNEIILHEAGHEFEIVDAEPRRIKRIRLTLKDAVQNSTQCEEIETVIVDDDTPKL